MTNNVKMIALLSTALIAMVSFATVAEAGIKCKGRYQVVSGNLISTPYCEDNYLAKIARGYGMRVSNKAIRNNPNTKKRACNLVGHDTRVQDICTPYNYRHRKRF